MAVLDLTQKFVDELVHARSDDGTPVLIETDMSDDEIRTIAEYVGVPWPKVQAIVWLAEARIDQEGDS